MATDRKTNLYVVAGPIEHAGDAPRRTQIRRLTAREVIDHADVKPLLKVAHWAGIAVGASLTAVAFAIPLVLAAALRTLIRAVRR